ncbi:receptor-like protein 7 [Tanacetum coccineum]
MAKSLHMIMLILVLYVNTFTFATKTSSLSRVDECFMLFKFKKSMSSNDSASSNHRAYPKVASWSNGTSDCCLWDGVDCSSSHVNGLDLSSSYLYGPIYSNNSLFNLIHLRRLNLADNNFRFSQIPSGIGRLSQLAYLNFSNSLLSGHVPKEITQLSQLVSLDLTGNQLKLQSPGFRNLVQNSSKTLKELFLSDVNISSEIPDVLANSSSLTSLVLRDCGLTGYFPLGIFDLPTLQHLDVQGNRALSGYFTEFNGSSRLKDLIVAETNFQGEVPASIKNLIHLNQLNLSSCFFNGPLPMSVSNLTQLAVLDLGSNYFSGPIPPLGSLTKLTHLSLQFNSFDRSNLCDWLGTFSNLLYLDLRYNGLNCEIPSSIGNQTKLKEIYLYGNDMVGQIPSSITNLTHITALDLSNNKFTGHLPSLERLLNLTYLSLGSNNFNRWKLPDWLGKLNKITHLDLAAVNLYGEIPSSFFNMTQVGMLDLSSNQLEGQITSSLLNLRNLESIHLYDNKIRGTVDVNLFLSLKKLKHLYLGGNIITLSAIHNHTNNPPPNFIVLSLVSCNLRVFPEFLRFQQQLLELYLGDNKLDGLVPEWMWNISKKTLSVLSLTQNRLTGFEHHSPVAPWVSLQTLDLSHNMLHGSIPMPPPATKNFFVSNNTLTGEIPPSLCNLQYIQLLDLSFNNITGSIPSCLGKLSNSLSVLSLRGNKLQGTIPNTFTNECKLQMMSINTNKMKGRVPRSFENCASLEILDLGNNHIEDMFPSMLGALPELQVLILKSNKFHGAVRFSSPSNYNFPKLRIIDLSYNSFSGDLPQQYFQDWSAMKKIQTTAEYMQSEISIIQEYDNEVYYSWVGNYSYSMNIINKGVKTEYTKIIDVFVVIDLSSNMFGGIIPESITDLSGLQLLNLSNNELSGAIPLSMGSLTRLESLDLSSNKLSGKMPQELVKLNFLGVLNVSYNNLTGPIPQGTQFDTFLNNSYTGNSELCGYPLSKKCGKSELSKAPVVSLDQDTESDFPSGVDWVVILSGLGSGLVIGVIFGNHLMMRYYKWFLERF